jgi:predicted nucleic acid-binding protein
LIVVDASVAVKWFVPEPGSAEAEALIAADLARAAPEQIAVEVGQALFRHHRAGRITLDHVRSSVRKLHKTVNTSPTWLVDDAVEISAACGCSLYDALYVAAAERWDCHLVTADAKLRNKLAGSAWAGRVLLLRVSGGTPPGQGAK